MKKGIYLTVMSYILLQLFSCGSSSKIVKESHQEANGFTWYETSKKGRHGALNAKGKEIISLNKEYDEITFHEIDGHVGYFLVHKNQKIGVYDVSGKKIFPMVQASSIYFTDEFWIYDGGTSLRPGYTLDSEGRSIKCRYDLYDKYFDEGCTYFYKEKWKKAKKKFKKAAKYKKNFNVYYNLAASYLNMGVGYYNKAWHYYHESLKYPHSEKDKENAYRYMDLAKKLQRERDRYAQQMMQSVSTALFLGNFSTPQLTPSSTGKNPTPENQKTRTEDNTQIEKEKTKCGVCGGTGRVVEYAPGFGVSEEKYCKECNKWVLSTHYHNNCKYCNGKGYK